MTFQIMTPPLTPRSSFDPFALGIFVLICLGLNYAIVHRSGVVNLGLQVLYVGWLVVGSA